MGMNNSKYKRGWMSHIRMLRSLSGHGGVLSMIGLNEIDNNSTYR